MTNFKKDYDLFSKSNKQPSDLIRQLSVSDSVLNCELLTNYESLINRPIKDSEFNLICKFVFDFDSNLSVGLITYNLFRLFTEDKDGDEVTSTRKAMFRLNDLKDDTKSSEIYESIVEIIQDYSDDIDYLL